MHKIILTIIILWSLPSLVVAQNSTAGVIPDLGLQVFIDSAFANSPVIKDNQNKLRYSDLNLKQAIAELSAPKIYIASEVLIAPYVNNNGKFISSNPDNKAIGYDAGITNGGLYSATTHAKLPLFTASGKKAYREVASAQTETYTNQIELSKHELEQQVTYQYVDCYLAQLQITYIQKTIDLLQEQQAIVKTLVLNALAKQSDYLLLGIEIQNQKIQLAQFQSDYATAFLQLKTICGISDTTLKQIAPPEIVPRRPNNDSKVLKIYRTDSLQIMAAQNVFNLKYKPSFSLYADGGLNAIEIPGIQRKFGVSAGITFNWMLYDGKQKRLEQQKNAILLNTTQTYRTGFLKQHQLQKQNTLKELSYAKGILLQKQQQVADYVQLLQLYEVQLGQGQLSVIDYLNTIRSYGNLQRDLAIAEANILRIINEYNYLNW
ncbi:MAG: TolC family protein [Bacteroidota bacterium]